MQLTSDQVKQALPWKELITALQDIFARDDICSPIRHHHHLPVPETLDATLLLMPAWIEGEYLGVKQVNVFPGNRWQNLPGLTSHYTLSCGKTGRTLAMLDGNELTSRRTAAASALAASFLSKENAQNLLMVGAGAMSRRLIAAHMSIRPIARIVIWNRHIAASAELVAELQQQGINAEVCALDQLQSAVQQADIISCATMSTEPLVCGEWLKPGAHLDLVGSFTPTMRETDDIALQRGAVFVDTRAGALSETGELIIPIEQGSFSADAIQAELSELSRGQHRGRMDLGNSDNAITVFKSVGDSREDLAAAILAYKNHSA